MNAEFTNLLMLNFAWHHVFTNLCVEQIVNLFYWVNSDMLPTLLQHKTHGIKRA